MMVLSQSGLLNPANPAQKVHPN